MIHLKIFLQQQRVKPKTMAKLRSRFPKGDGQFHQKPSRNKWLGRIHATSARGQFKSKWWRRVRWKLLAWSSSSTQKVGFGSFLFPRDTVSFFSSGNGDGFASRRRDIELLSVPIPRALWPLTFERWYEERDVPGLLLIRRRSYVNWNGALASQSSNTNDRLIERLLFASELGIKGRRRKKSASPRKLLRCPYKSGPLISPIFTFIAFMEIFPRKTEDRPKNHDDIDDDLNDEIVNCVVNDTSTAIFVFLV